MRAIVASILMISMVMIPGFVSSSEEDKGAPEMVLHGGNKGDVPFPHRMHQAALDDCTACHDLFGKEKGLIEKLKKEGTLRSKQVMNTKCLGCHKKLKKAGEDHGPVRCSECHIKKK